MPDPLEVLVIDDHEDFGQALCALLGTSGHRATYAANTETARARFRERVPHVVVLDLGIAGPEREVGRPALALAGEMKAHTLPVPLVFVFTGYHALERAARAVGCDAFVLKPNVAALLSAIEGAAKARSNGARPREVS